MPCKPPDFKTAAELIRDLAAGRTSDECLSRSSASRAYYWAYHVALELADSLNLPWPGKEVKGGSHDRLIARLFLGVSAVTPETAKYLRQGTANLKTLKDRRVQADYHLHAAVDNNHAHQSLHLAENVVGNYQKVKGA